MTAPTAAAPREPLPARIGSALASYGGFAPAIVLLGLFFLVPLGIIACYSFWETFNYAVVHHWTLDNYHYFFTTGVRVEMWATLCVGACGGDRDRWRFRSLWLCQCRRGCGVRCSSS